MNRKLQIYLECTPENYDGPVSITIKCKKSEKNGLPYDIRCVLFDAMQRHPQFKDVIIEEKP